MPPKNNPKPPIVKALSLSTNWKLEKKKKNPIMTIIAPLPTFCQSTIIRSISYQSINSSNTQNKFKMDIAREFAPDWMYDCLDEARKIIITYHTHVDAREFLEKCEFRIWIQTDKPNAYGYVKLGTHPMYNIGIHNVLKEPTKENIRMVTIVLVHELLHTIHPDDENHSIVTPLEKVFSNKAGYYDALKEMELLAYNGKMRFCDE